MRAILVAASLLLQAVASGDKPALYPHDVARWVDHPRPSLDEPTARDAWMRAANRSPHDWHVFLKDGQVCAQLEGEPAELPPPAPDFEIERKDVPLSRGAHGRSFARVDDGWLVGFNHGEFGAALYWYSSDGKDVAKVSDHQVAGFLETPEGLLAIEGLAHGGRSSGSLIRVARPEPGKPWQATTVLELPAAPRAITRLPDGKFLITLSDSLVSVNKEFKLHVLLRDRDLAWIYATSSVLAPDGTRLFIGMRQYVAEYELATGIIRWLVPDESFVNTSTR